MFSGNGSVSIGVASTVVLPECVVKRKRVTFVNDSIGTIYLCKAASAQINTGIRLNASGGSYEDAPDASGYLYQGIYTAISTAAASNLTYIEEY